MNIASAADCAPTHSYLTNSHQTGWHQQWHQSSRRSAREVLSGFTNRACCVWIWLRLGVEVSPELSWAPVGTCHEIFFTKGQLSNYAGCMTQVRPRFLDSNAGHAARKMNAATCALLRSPTDHRQSALIGARKRYCADGGWHQCNR